MDGSARAAVLAAIVAAVAAIIAAGVSASSTLQLRAREEAFTDRQRAAEFLTERLTKLYVPVSMHLASTKALFERFFEETTTTAEKTAIEHELRTHNTAIRQALMDWSVYIEPADGDPSCDVDTMVTDLLEHLIQWETVYRLKYDYKVYSGPVFAGISEFGFRAFPQGDCGADVHFRSTSLRLRRALHLLRPVESGGVNP